jgi:serine/threonine-protein kinase
MSPEQAQGGVDRRSTCGRWGGADELATASCRSGETEAAVVHSILHNDQEPVTALRAGLPLELDRAVGKALAKDPGERYQHAADFLVDMRTLRGRLQLESKAQRLAATAARRRGLLVAGLAAGSGIAGVGLWS